MSAFEQSFREAEEIAMRFLQVDFGFAATDRRITDDGTIWTGGIARYESTGSTTSGTPRGWSVTLSFFPFRLELDLEVSSESGASFSVAELHQLEHGAGLPAREHNLYESVRDTNAQRAEFERLAMALRGSGKRFFRGDGTLWSDLDAQRRSVAQDDEDTRRLFASERAFKAKDWTQVVQLLEHASDRLNPEGAARLAYARKKLQGAT
jgi:hypothetical protein